MIQILGTEEDEYVSHCRLGLVDFLNIFLFMEDIKLPNVMLAILPDLDGEWRYRARYQEIPRKLRPMSTVMMASVQNYKEFLYGQAHA